MVRAGAVVCATCGTPIVNEDLATFSSLDLPSGVSRRAFREACARIPEATLDGKVWSVPRAAWFAARRRRRPIAKVTATSLPIVDDIDAEIAAAGLRSTRTA